MSSSDHAIWLAACFADLGFEIQDGLPAESAAADEERPAVLLADHRVALANAPARRLGIRPGSTLATARSLVPELLHVQRDAQAERERLAWLGQVGYRYSSRVSVVWDDAPELVRAAPGLLIEVRGSERLFGGLAALADDLHRRFGRLGHRTRSAMAATPLAALLLARAGYCGFPGDAAAALRQVPIGCANFSAQERERLANMGFTRFGSLLDLPAAELGKRFHPGMVDYLHRLSGQKPDPRPFIEPPEQFRSALHLLQSVDAKDALLLPMRRLASELAHWLAKRRLGAEMLTWEFTTLGGRKASFAVRFRDATRSDAAFLALSRLRLERAELPKEVMSISLAAGLTMPLAPAAADLLAMRDAENKALASRAELVDLLAARLGDEAVRTLGPVDDHRPECAWTTLPTTSKPPARRSPARKDVEASFAHRRPLWLLAEPRPVAIERYELRSGPERIETGWWDAPEFRQFRDYYVAVSTSGARCWLYYDRRERSAAKAGPRSAATTEPADDGNGRWYLHGYFA